MAEVVELSPEARAFIARGLEGRPAAGLTAEDFPSLRQQLRALYGAWSERALVRHNVTATDVEIGGVRFLQVTPNGTTPERVVFYCFGGGMVTGSPFEDLTITAFLARHARAKILCPYYPLAPEHPYPAAVNHVVAAYRAVRRANGMLALAGESAGGTLCLNLLQRLTPEEMPYAVALMSPWCDVTNSGESMVANDGRDPTLRRAEALHVAGLYAGPVDTAQGEVSPLAGDFTGITAPFFISTGTRDLLQSDSERLAAKLRATGIPVTLRVWPEMWHVFEFYEGLPEGDRSLGEIASFLVDAAR